MLVKIVFLCPKVPLAGGQKIKNKGSAMSVGLLVVRFQYGLYVVVHLSKFVSLFSVFTRSMSGVSCRFTLAVWRLVFPILPFCICLSQ